MIEDLLLIEELVFEDESRPFRRWYSRQSSEAKAQIDVRLERLKRRNYGAHRRLPRGIVELKIDFGQGLRIYGGELKGKFFLLVHGGFKKTQQKDIRFATDLWMAFTKNIGKLA